MFYEFFFKWIKPENFKWVEDFFFAEICKMLLHILSEEVDFVKNRNRI